LATKEIKTYSLTEMNDNYIGKFGTGDREKYEHELRMVKAEINFNIKLQDNFVKLA